MKRDKDCNTFIRVQKQDSFYSGFTNDRLLTHMITCMNPNEIVDYLFDDIDIYEPNNSVCTSRKRAPASCSGCFNNNVMVPSDGDPASHGCKNSVDEYCNIEFGMIGNIQAADTFSSKSAVTAGYGSAESINRTADHGRSMHFQKRDTVTERMAILKI